VEKTGGKRKDKRRINNVDLPQSHIKRKKKKKYRGQVLGKENELLPGPNKKTGNRFGKDFPRNR